VFTVGVEAYRGVLPVYANLPEVGFADRATELANLATQADFGCPT
jgi:hypothetical protein